MCLYDDRKHGPINRRGTRSNWEESDSTFRAADGLVVELMFTISLDTAFTSGVCSKLELSCI